MADSPLCVQAACVYCILETIEFVCGEGCVTQTLHISTGKRPCTTCVSMSWSNARLRWIASRVSPREPVGSCGRSCRCKMKIS